VLVFRRDRREERDVIVGRADAKGSFIIERKGEITSSG
tara:strand:- start:483 stop:596 length:114 start_codon:yes stop_codon:yes gene_type:complete